MTKSKSCSCGGSATAKWNFSTCDYEFEGGYGKVNVNITCDYDEIDKGCSHPYDSCPTCEYCQYVHSYYCYSDTPVPATFDVYSHGNLNAVLWFMKGNSRTVTNYDCGFDNETGGSSCSSGSWTIDNKYDKTKEVTCGDCQYVISI